MKVFGPLCSGSSDIARQLLEGIRSVDPSLKEVVVDGLLKAYYEIFNSLPPGTSLDFDPRTNFDDGRQVMRLVEAEFDSAKNRKLPHRWVFADNQEKFEFAANC